jgi:hypothetical protein
LRRKKEVVEGNSRFRQHRSLAKTEGCDPIEAKFHHLIVVFSGHSPTFSSPLDLNDTARLGGDDIKIVARFFVFLVKEV